MVRTTVKFEKTMPDLSQKTVREKYIVEAITPTEAEKKTTEEMSYYISGGFAIQSCKEMGFKEVFFDDKGDRYYLAKVSFITLNADTGKEKRTNITYLVQASTLKEALRHVEVAMNCGMQDWEVTALTETKYLDVFEYKAPASETEAEEVTEQQDTEQHDADRKDGEEE